MSAAAQHSPLVHSKAAPTESLAVQATGVPWYLWTGVVAVTCSYIGGAWDVSWHRSIGRDTFWTPAHLLIYACGLLAGIVGIWFVARCTFGNDPSFRARSVSIFGIRAPLGVFFAGWGGLAMVTSAPFDNWWHSAYGLDVKIVSPPHTLLILGLRGVSLGVLFLILAEMNRAADAETLNHVRLRALFLYLGGLTIGGQMFFLQEYTFDILLHQALAYVAMGIALPLFFAAFSTASRFRWAASTCAAVYTAFLMGEILILPLFPAHAKLGPVWYPVTHMVPAKFPVLIVAPALALDLLWHHTRTWKPSQIALASGAVFTAVLFVVEWPFADFLMSHVSQNRFFGTIYFDFNSHPDGYDRLRHFFAPDHGLLLAFGLVRASVYAALSTWVGLAFGRWMRGIQR